MNPPSQSRVRPAQVCQSLLAALRAADGRRRKRKRDQTPDTIGLALKRELLEQAVRDDPGPDEFERWLMDYTAAHDSAGGVAAMARNVYDEWRLASSVSEFKQWLEQGAPSEDADQVSAQNDPVTPLPRKSV